MQKRNNMYRYTYKITCTTGAFKNKVYFGQHTTNNLDDGYKGCGKKLLDYYKKYPNDYIKEIISFYDTDEDLNNAEYELIHPHLGKEYCLNCKEGGSGGSYKGINKGIKHNAEWNTKTSETNWLKNLDSGKYDETYEKWCKTIKSVNSNPEKADRHSIYMKEYYLTHSSPAKGREVTEDERQRISNSLKEYYKKNGHPSTGTHHSEETRKKQSESRLGKSPGNKGKKLNKITHKYEEQ